MVNERDEIGPTLCRTILHPCEKEALRVALQLLGPQRGQASSTTKSAVGRLRDHARLRARFACGSAWGRFLHRSHGGSVLDGVFVGEHGSWNRNPPVGYKVVFVPFRAGRPAGTPSTLSLASVEQMAKLADVLSGWPSIRAALC